MERRLERDLPDEETTVAAGIGLGRACLANGLSAGITVYLFGELGAGKTTFSRGVLRAFGHEGAVKSPTYTLVEPYEMGDWRVYHFDLYRLGDPEELEFMGVRDYFAPGCLSLVEWPQRGVGILPEPDLEVSLEVSGAGRKIRIGAHSPNGERVLAAAEKLL